MPTMLVVFYYCQYYCSVVIGGGRAMVLAKDNTESCFRKLTTNFTVMLVTSPSAVQTTVTGTVFLYITISTRLNSFHNSSVIIRYFLIR